MSGKGHGFSRQQRLLKAAEFRQVFSRGWRNGNRYLGLVAVENGLDQARLGLAISKKQIKTAVGRNRIKRLVRESFRQNQGRLGSYDIVIMARAAAATADNSELCRALEQLWQKLARRCKSC